MYPRASRSWKIGCMLAFVCFCALVNSAIARDLSADEKARLTQTVAQFSEALQSKNVEETIRLSLPLRVLAHLAEKTKSSPEQVALVVAETLREALNQAKIGSFSMNMEKADFRTLADGTPYAFISTSTALIVAGQGKFVVDSHCLAMLDEARWFLVRTSDLQQKMLLTAAYPAFLGIEFPSESVRLLEE